MAHIFNQNASFVDQNLKLLNYIQILLFLYLSSLSKPTQRRQSYIYDEL